MSMTELERRLLPIVVELAQGELAGDDQGNYCLHCEVRYPYLEDKEPEHDPDCLIVRARSVLREMGQPMKLFRFSWEYFYDQGAYRINPRWVEQDYSFYAQDASGFDSEQFLLERYTPSTSTRLKVSVPPLRNKTLVLVREV